MCPSTSSIFEALHVFVFILQFSGVCLFYILVLYLPYSRHLASVASRFSSDTTVSSSPPASSSDFSAKSAACVDSKTTQKISTKSTQSSRFSTGMTPYVMQCANGHSFSPYTVKGIMLLLILSPMLPIFSFCIRPVMRRYTAVQVGDHIV